MKKVCAILAVVTFGLGMVACEADSSVEETEALFELEQEASDGEIHGSSERD